MSDYSMRWAITGITILCLSMTLFIICCLVAIFVNPAFSQAARGTVAVCWGIGSGFLIIGTLIVRHGGE